MSARVLVVDDIEVNRRLLEAKLSVEYYDVITAKDGEEALALTQSELPDIVLLDVMMPKMDGFEVCRRLKSDPATTHIPVVMVTALSEQSDKVAGLVAGADDFLTKPVDDWVLRTRMRSLLRLKMAFDELLRRRSTGAELGVVTAECLVDDVRDANILIIDGSPSVAKTRDTLVSEGNTVEVASSAAEGLAKAERSPFELVLVRLKLQDGDPLRVCAQLRTMEATRSVPILLIAEEHDRERTETAIDIGINDYLTSPIDPSELIARVRTQIRRKRYNDKLRADYEHGLVAALKDDLTGAYNRRYLDTHLTAQLRGKVTDGKTTSVVMLDIDHFKQINDTHGHAAGDDVLRQLVPRVASSVRDFDTVARYGGEEFVVVLSGTGIKTAAKVAERLRGRIEAEPFTSGDLCMPVTISVGVAQAYPDELAADLLMRADAALYGAKKAGRNRVVRADADGVGTQERAISSSLP